MYERRSNLSPIHSRVEVNGTTPHDTWDRVLTHDRKVLRDLQCTREDRLAKSLGESFGWKNRLASIFLGLNFAKIIASYHEIICLVLEPLSPKANAFNFSMRSHGLNDSTIVISQMGKDNDLRDDPGPSKLDSLDRHGKRGLKRSPRACDECRVRKIKCSGLRPCEACKQFHRSKLYSILPPS